MPFLRGARPSQAGQASGRHTGHPAHVMTLIEVHVIPQAVVHPQAPARSATLFLFAGAALTSASAAACRNGVFHDGTASSTYLFLFHGRGSNSRRTPACWAFLTLPYSKWVNGPRLGPASSSIRLNTDTILTAQRSLFNLRLRKEERPKITWRRTVEAKRREQNMA
uniref:Secreted protein n=1 Tax=Knipowitschia caucasica TaxID=637954 RepID=A0AAV2LRI3_KNICA